MWPFRDWVIRALNEDMPFDRFTIEQLAGDLLPDPQKTQIIATAFHRNTLINHEGGSDPEQFRVEAAMDRVNTTGAVWLGLTVGCAQCHSHKFDPIAQREYYQLFAFFNSAEGGSWRARWAAPERAAAANAPGARCARSAPRRLGTRGAGSAGCARPGFADRARFASGVGGKCPATGRLVCRAL
jgi:hypothetical protein